jgi:hypothetical protein
VTVPFEGSLEEMIKEPVRELAVEGLKVMLILHEPPLAIVPQGLSVMAKERLPVFDTEVSTRLEVPEFLIVIFLTRDVDFAGTVPKLTAVADKAILGGAHVPVRLTAEVGFLISLEGIVRVAAFDPKDVAVKLTVMAQD